MTWRDQQEGYRVGLSRLTLPFCFIYGSVILLIPAGLIMILYGKGYPLTWPPAALPSRLVLANTIVPLGIMFGAWLINAFLFGYLLPSRTVRLLPRHLAWKQLWLPKRIRWKQITEIVETSEHIFFCQNVPMATVVPKRAFPNQKQAAAFLEQARHFWHEATGLPPSPIPDSVGVWPPAPCPSDSAEPGDGREG